MPKITLEFIPKETASDLLNRGFKEALKQGIRKPTNVIFKPTVVVFHNEGKVVEGGIQVSTWEMTVEEG